MSNTETATFRESYNQLLAESDTPKGNSWGSNPRKLPLRAIRQCPQVFQPRGDANVSAESEAHRRTLINAIFDVPKNELEPITVWWSGGAWYLIDGHHRFEAYLNVAKQKRWKDNHKIPVAAFRGDLKSAIAEATRLNAKDKLRMQKDDKLNRAWLLVVLGEGWSKHGIARVCGIGTTTVARMRSRLAELKALREAAPEEGLEDFTDMTWAEAQEDPSKVKTYDEAWEDRQAKEWAQRLSRTFGGKLRGQPEIFWKAIEMHSEGLAKGLKDWLGVPIHDDLESDF